MSSEVPATEPVLSTSRLIWLGAISILLCLTFFFFFFAPLPLSIALILYGRAKGFGLFVCSLMVIMTIGLNFFSFPGVPFTPHLVVFFVASCLVASGVAEVIFRKIHPIRGLFYSSISILSVMVIFITATLSFVEGDPREHLTTLIEEQVPLIKDQLNQVAQEGGQESEEALSALGSIDDPKKIASDFFFHLPRMMIMITFIWLWAMLLILLKNHRFFSQKYDYPFTDQSLLNFRNPDWTLFPVVFALMLSLLGDDLGVANGQKIGIELLYVMGMFFFFQGHGVIHAFFDMSNLYGFFRTLAIAILIIFASKAIAALGLMDVWFDFRERFKKQKKKMDQQE